jgi:hypothetical protein
MTDLSVNLAILIAGSVMELRLISVIRVMMVTFEIFCMIRILVFLIVQPINMRISWVLMGMCPIRFVLFATIIAPNVMVPPTPTAPHAPPATSSTTVTPAKTPEISHNAPPNSTATTKILQTPYAHPATSFAVTATAQKQANASHAPMDTG